MERLVLRRLVLLGTPLALAVLEVCHPKPSAVADAVEQGGWFMWFHSIQVPLIGLMALAVYLLTEGLPFILLILAGVLLLGGHPFRGAL